MVDVYCHSFPEQACSVNESSRILSPSTYQNGIRIRRRTVIVKAYLDHGLLLRPAPDTGLERTGAG